MSAGRSGPTEYRATLERVSDWSRATRSFFFRLASGTSLAFDPGQFVSLALPVGERPPLVRAYSVASSPEDAGLIEICVDRVPDGEGSRYLFGLAPGADVVLTGPFGSFTLADPPATPLVFIGHGTGIAPMLPMVRRALARGGDYPIAVFQGAAAGAPVIYRDAFASLARTHARLRWEVLQTAVGTAASANPDLERVVHERFVEAARERDTHFWICAVGALATRVRDVLRAAGYVRRAVRCEKW